MQLSLEILLLFLGAVAIAGYLVAGSYLRKWMPLFMYAFPVTAVASTLISAFAFGEPSADFTMVFFGWFLNSFWLIAYIAVFPGICGHTGINYAIKYVNPLIVSVMLLLEPAIGSVIGYLVGVSGIPGIWTIIGAPILLLGLGIVTGTAHKREQKEKNKPMEHIKMDEFSEMTDL
eukprot:TRINITY_DN8869_c0_g1_i3.p2 TRINITY_DN8869_c0_g1~~TRINITY_DN8869_c0_g1_i3.p2  ORF type:complete len:175 (+),score=42.00 TRINITY_DN8869_c0_g1_i3:597-1121(+)